MATVQLSPPAAPFQRIKNPGESITIKTAGKVLVIPSSGSTVLPSFNRYTLDTNRLTTAESPFGGLKGSGSPDYAVGTVYTATDNIYLTDTAGNNSTKTLTAGKLKEVSSLTVNTTTKTITAEFIISNTGTSNTPTTIDDCDNNTNWAAMSAKTMTVTTESGFIKAVGTSNNANFVAKKTYTVAKDFSACNFITFDAKSSISAPLYLWVHSADGGAVWNKTALTIGTDWTHFVLPLDSLTGTALTCPISRTGTLTKSAVTDISIGVSGSPLTDGTAITIYIDNIKGDVGKPAYVEIQVPDNLNADSSLEVQTWNSTAYASIGSYKLDSVYAAVGTPTSANWKMADGTKFDDCYNLAPYGRALFPKSYSGQTVNGSTGTLQYSTNKGTKYRIGLRVDLPPSGNGQPNFSKVRLKLIFTYANSGQTSYEFADSLNTSFGLQNMAYPWIALFDPAGSEIDYYLFTHRPKNLIRRRNDSGEVYELVLYPGNGAIYHGKIKYASLTLDSNSNLIPNCLEDAVNGSLAKFLAPYMFRDDLGIITFTSTGQVFNPLIEATAGAKILWTFDDGTTSTLAAPSKDFGSAGTHVTSLKVTPWSALTKMNLGYDQADGGPTTLNYRAQQNVTRITGLDNATGLTIITTTGNPLQEIDLSNMPALQYYESYATTALENVILSNNPALIRVCVESCNVSNLNLAAAPHLEDLRGSLQTGGQITIDWGTCGASLYHFCVRDITDVNQVPFSQFLALKVLYCWSSGLSGALLIPSTAIEEIQAQSNNFSSITLPATAPNLFDVRLYNNDFTQETIDYILEKVDGYGRSNGTMNITLNATPSETGITHKNNLIARGWTVYTD